MQGLLSILSLFCNKLDKFNNTVLSMNVRFYLTLKAPPIICSIIFYENRLLADDSHEISYIIFVEN